ncbi:MAG: DUF2163 domain-containing protein [Rickettsiales bacterium]
MKTLSSALTNHLQQDVTTLATCWKLTRRDGAVMGFTDHDRDLTVSGQSYVAATGFTPTAIEGSAGLAVDNLDVEGMLDSAAISEEDIHAGKYDHAEIEVFMVNYMSPSDGILPLRTGWLGEVRYTSGKFVAEVRGLTQRLQQRVGELYSPGCRADFGDSRCKINLATFTTTGTLTGATSRTVLLDSARTENSGVFSFGRITFTSGANDGISMEIKQYTKGKMMLVLPLPYQPQAGNAYTITQGCDKSFSTCKTRYNNAVNFRGEPHVPGLDRILETASTRSEW